MLKIIISPFDLIRPTKGSQVLMSCTRYNYTWLVLISHYSFIDILYIYLILFAGVRENIRVVPSRKSLLSLQGSLCWGSPQLPAKTGNARGRKKAPGCLISFPFSWTAAPQSFLRTFSLHLHLKLSCAILLTVLLYC